ncbi:MULTISPECIES: response regulator [Anaeromyxobacter]|uniref:response regulator n=1 Tax=Anaeromyxobacter TaxID=161492 RepID=UPI001F5A1893|nr:MULTISPECIES: response regulator [unclassified Anaeromyxobacter]
MNATTIRRPRALLLDDDANVLRLLGAALEARGFEVRAAADATSGLGLLLDELLDLDVLVVDSALPGRDAVSFVHLVRHAGGERDLGIVVLAAGAARGLCEQLLALGADAVVDRALGPAAAAEAVGAVASRRAQPAPLRAADEVHPAARGTLVVSTVAAPAPRQRLADRRRGFTPALRIACATAGGLAAVAVAR